MYEMIVILVLLGAAFFDIRTGKIPNWYQSLSLITLIIIGTTNLSDYKITEMLFNGLIVFVPLNIVWTITTAISFKAIGAGDVKLFTVAAIAIPTKDIWFIILISLVLAAFVGCFKVSIKRLGEMTKEVLNFVVYGIPGKNEKNAVKIPVGPMVLVSYLIYISPIYEIFKRYWEVL